MWAARWIRRGAAAADAKPTGVLDNRLFRLVVMPARSYLRAVGMAALGRRVNFIGRVSSDQLGEVL